ncbi:MAG: hypothetical protein U1C71_03330, partial [archaeon]|nr:hypothetical protein [archaeon]
TRGMARKPLPSKNQFLPKIQLLGVLVLSACTALSPKQGDKKPIWRFPPMKDFTAGVHTFIPPEEFNPTSFLILGATRKQDHSIQLNPFLGTWGRLGNGNYGWHIGAIPDNREPEMTQFLAGVAREFAGGKVTVGGGTTFVRDALSKELAGRLKVNKNTQFTLSMDPTKPLKTGILNLEHSFGEFAGTTVIGYVERGWDGNDNWRVGSSLERGRVTWDVAYHVGLQDYINQFSYGLGKDGRHFLFITPVYDDKTNKWELSAGINFTFFGLGRRRQQRKVSTGNSKRPLPPSVWRKRAGNTAPRRTPRGSPPRRRAR